MLLMAGCTASSGVGLQPCEQVRESAETLAGSRAAWAVEAQYGGVMRDAAAEQRLERVLGSIAALDPSLGRVRVRLLACDQINAVSLPGGRIYVTRGLYVRLRRDDWLAAVLAHEFAHLASHDHFKPRCTTQDESLQREVDADVKAGEYLQRAGGNPAAMAEVVHLIQDVLPPGWAERRMHALSRSLAVDSDNLGYARLD